MNLKDVGEFGFINRIASRIKPGSGVSLGIGDDAAAFIPTPGCRTLVTTDMLVEGVHFDLSFTSPFLLGRKSLAVNISDIAAMGAVPRFALLSLAVPALLDLEFLDTFIDGLLAMADETGVTLIGGDTCSSRGELVISVTLMGEQRPEQVVTRSGARPGDLIYITGTLGDSALGLELLRRGERESAAITRHLDPSPRCDAGRRLAEAGITTAMIDVSDGLLADLGHILEQSGAGAIVMLDRLPLSPEYHNRINEFPDNPFALALSGGEDYELLFTAPPEREQELGNLFTSFSLPVTRIGEITSANGITIITPDGKPYIPVSCGFNHFT